MDNTVAIVGVALAVLVAITLVRSLRRVAADERLIVERLGMHARTAGPGWTFIVPLIEKGVLIPLTEFMPAWQAYTEDELRKKLVADYYRNVNLPS